MKSLLTLSIALTALSFSGFSQYNQHNQGRQVKSKDSFTYLSTSLRWAMAVSKNQKIVTPLRGENYWNYTNSTRNKGQVKSLDSHQPSTSSIKTAFQWHNENSKLKPDYSGFVFLAYSLLSNTNLHMESQRSQIQNP